MRKATVLGFTLGCYLGWRAARSRIGRRLFTARPAPSEHVALSADKVRAIVDIGRERLRDLLEQALARPAA